MRHTVRPAVWHDLGEGVGRRRYTADDQGNTTSLENDLCFGTPSWNSRQLWLTIEP